MAAKLQWPSVSPYCGFKTLQLVLNKEQQKATFDWETVLVKNYFRRLKWKKKQNLKLHLILFRECVSISNAVQLAASRN